MKRTDDELSFMIYVDRSRKKTIKAHQSVSQHISQQHGTMRLALASQVVQPKNYVGYNAAPEMTGLKTLAERREGGCLKFALNATQNPIAS